MSNNKISKWAINCAYEIDPNWMNKYAKIIERHHKAHLARQRKRNRDALMKRINNDLGWL